MLIRILSQQIVVSTSQSSRTTTSAEQTQTTAPANQDPVTLKSVRGQTISQWEMAMAQYQQVAKKNLASLQRSNRSSRRAALAQRAENLKQRVKILQQMMSMASSHTAKGLAQVLSRLAKELKSLASELRSLSGGGGDSQPINVSVGGQINADSSTTSDSRDSADVGSSASINTSTPDLASNVPTDAGAATDASTDSSSGQDQTDTTVSQPANSNSEAADDAQEKIANAALANSLQELAAKLKGMRNLLKALVREQPGGKKLMDDMDHDFNEIDKTMTDINNNTSQAELAGDSAVTGGQIDVSA